MDQRFIFLKSLQPQCVSKEVNVFNLKLGSVECTFKTFIAHITSVAFRYYIIKFRYSNFDICSYTLHHVTLVVYVLFRLIITGITKL